MRTRERTPQAEEIFDTREETKHWYLFFMPFIYKGFNRGISLTSKSFPSGGDTFLLDPFTPDDDVGVFDFQTQAKAALKQQGYVAAAAAVGTTENVIKKTITNAVQENLSSKELATLIAKNFDDMKGYRALRIARTELTGAMNNGSANWMKGEGYPEKEWFTVLDGRERENHRAASGQRVLVDDYFNVGGYDAYAPADTNLPVEERVNCRCAIIPVGVPVERLNKYAITFLRLHGSLERQFVKTVEVEFNRQKQRILKNLTTLNL